MSSEYEGDLGFISHEKGTGCLFLSMSSRGGERYCVYAPHKPRCELGRGGHFFPTFVARHRRLECSNDASRSYPHVRIREGLSWTYPGGRIQMEPKTVGRSILPPPKAENEVLRICLWSILIQKSLWVEFVGIWVHLFVTGHRPMPR